MNRLSPPALAIRSAVSCPGSAAMSETATLAPASAKAIALARPIPPAPPVTTATFPVKPVSLIVTPFVYL
jgi:hypothetical protein